MNKSILITIAAVLTGSLAFGAVCLQSKAQNEAARESNPPDPKSEKADLPGKEEKSENKEGTAKGIVKHSNSQSFKADVLEAKEPVLVDFYASWCGPCRAMAPILEELAGEYSGKVTVCKVDVDENQELAAKYEIRGIPALKVFKNGKIVNEVTGMISKSELAAILDSANN